MRRHEQRVGEEPQFLDPIKPGSTIIFSSCDTRNETPVLAPLFAILDAREVDSNGGQEEEREVHLGEEGILPVATMVVEQPTNEEMAELLHIQARSGRGR